MASIAEWINKIKTAIYGEEVRGAIWQSLEAMNTEVEAINVDSAQIEQNKTDIAGLKAGVAWSNADTVKLTTTSLQDFVAGHDLGIFYAWSPTANATTVGAPTTHSYHYMIIKTNATTAIVFAFKMTSGTGGVIATKQLYGGNWAAWETRLPA